MGRVSVFAAVLSLLSLALRALSTAWAALALVGAQTAPSRPNSLSALRDAVAPAASAKHLPRHVALILKSHNPPRRMLASFTLWLAAVGVEAVSLHFPNALHCIDSSAKLEFLRLMEEYGRGFGLRTLTNLDTLNCSASVCRLEFELPSKMREPPKPKIQKSHSVVFRIRFIDPSVDGISQIVAATKKLCTSSQAGSNIGRTSDKIDLKFVDELLKVPDFCEPELMYVFDGADDVLTLDYYPPWEIRLTEICHVKSPGIPSYENFLKGMDMYSKREKRIGT
ncbi:ditrans,polycis-polyprenyl diphosphate synthase [Entophlyctis sp. JEL0112]|nr:ditrans,polycis-polyprenyl diphosphate synthase [Entophlyctis sp. JEL0112]